MWNWQTFCNNKIESVLLNFPGKSNVITALGSGSNQKSILEHLCISSSLFPLRGKSIRKDLVMIPWRPHLPEAGSRLLFPGEESSVSQWRCKPSKAATQQTSVTCACISFWLSSWHMIKCRHIAKPFPPKKSLSSADLVRGKQSREEKANAKGNIRDESLAF